METSTKPTTTWKPFICWKGTHTEDWASWAVFHREVAAHELANGRVVLAAKNEEIAKKYDAREARAAKKRAKAVKP
jgi:hypothetical protein